MNQLRNLIPYQSTMTYKLLAEYCWMNMFGNSSVPTHKAISATKNNCTCSIQNLNKSMMITYKIMPTYDRGMHCVWFQLKIKRLKKYKQWCLVNDIKTNTINSGRSEVGRIILKLNTTLKLFFYSSMFITVLFVQSVSQPSMTLTQCRSRCTTLQTVEPLDEYIISQEYTKSMKVISKSKVDWLVV